MEITSNNYNEEENVISWKIFTALMESVSKVDYSWSLAWRSPVSYTATILSFTWSYPSTVGGGLMVIPWKVSQTTSLSGTTLSGDTFHTFSHPASQKLSHPWLRGSQRPDNKTLSTFPSLFLVGAQLPVRLGLPLKDQWWSFLRSVTWCRRWR